MLVEYRRRRVMVDCGADWLGRIEDLAPGGIVLTHAHPDHAWGLREGAPCPVWATAETWKDIDAYPIGQRRQVRAEEDVMVQGIRFTAYAVEHSTRCPAVGYRIAAGRTTVWYGPDVVYIHERERALQDVELYVGDGATLETPFVRKQGDHLVGHSPVRTQLTWCAKEDVPEALITHCGSQIVEGDERVLGPLVRRWAKERGLTAGVAFDGMERILR